jgi:hypothetical protein
MSKSKLDVEVLSDWMYGRVVSYSIKDQFGFAVTDDGQRVYLPHVSIVWDGQGNCDHQHDICSRALEVGQFVRFRVVKNGGRDGALEARNIKPVRDLPAREDVFFNR